MRKGDYMKKNAYVTFIIRNDSYLPGALVFGYSLRLQKTVHDLVCIVSDNISKEAIDSLKVIYDEVIVIDEVYVPHERRHERQDRPFLFSRFNAFRLGKDGDLGYKYDNIILCDCDLLALRKYDELFDLNAPAGIINEKKEYCMEYLDGKYIKPNTVENSGTWNWHEHYKDIPHGSIIPKQITDRIMEDKENMGVNASVMLFETSMDLYKSIMDDLANEEVQKEISTYNWPEMQYITLKLSGQWTNVDLRYSSFNGYPKVDVLYGIHFAGLKPWSIKNKSVKSFAKFEDYKLWYHTYLKMMKEYKELKTHKKLVRIEEFITNLLIEKGFPKAEHYTKDLNHFFKES
jgi:glycogenin glucosyltransferase